jgi:hypothetical protein
LNVATIELDMSANLGATASGPGGRASSGPAAGAPRESRELRPGEQPQDREQPRAAQQEPQGPEEQGELCRRPEGKHI